MTRPRRARTTMLRPRRRGWRRGVEIIEFVLVVPMCFLLISFSIDMGNLIFYTGSLHDAVYDAARTAAQFGYTGSDSSGPAATAFYNYVDESLPRERPKTVFQITTSQGTSTCGTSQQGGYIVVKAAFHMDYITPGLYTFFAIANATGDTVHATGVARCEVSRFP